MTRREYAYRLQLLIFHHICIFGAEPLFCVDLQYRVYLQWLPDFARLLMHDVAYRARNMIVRGIPYLDAIEKCTHYIRR
jgi:hypothetical protein